MTHKIHPLPPMPLLAAPPTWNQHPVSTSPQKLEETPLGNTITLHNNHKANVLVMAGVHGDESEGIFLAHLLLATGIPTPLIPCLNPDGALLRQRWNRNNVDLNRNLPADDWSPEPLNPRYPPGNAPGSEPETKAFLKALKMVQPSTVLSLHSYKESFVEIERPTKTLSNPINEAVEKFVGLANIERRLSIGYQTPGALGAYGLKNNLLILTYELERGASHQTLSELAEPLKNLILTLEKHRFTI